MPPLPAGGVRYFRKWLFDVPTVEENLAVGMVQDIEPWAIPPGGSVFLEDFLLDRPGMIYKRGGTSYQNVAVSPPSASNPIWVGVACPEFPGDPRVVGIASNGVGGHYVYDLTTGVTPSAISINQIEPFENPPLYINSAGARMVLTDSNNLSTGGTAPPGQIPRKIYLDPATHVLSVAPLAGTPPAAGVSCVHPPFLVLANGYNPPTYTAYYPNRIWFSNRADMENPWDVIYNFMDVAEPVVAMASHSGVLLVWTRHQLIRITGSAPPGDDLFDMSPQSIAQVGCIDARSVVKAAEGVYYANEDGVWITDGSGTRNIMLANGGISSYWHTLMQGFSVKLGNVVASGLYQNKFLFVSLIFSGTNTTFLCYLPTNSWTTLSNGMAADMFATSLSTSLISTDEIYLSSPFSTDATHCRLVKASGIFLPQVSNNTDADGSKILPTWKSRAFNQGTMGLKRYGYGHISYQMNSSGNPGLRVDIGRGLTSERIYEESLEGSPLPPTNVGQKRRRFRIFKDEQAINFQVTQTDTSDQTEIYSLEMEAGIFLQAEGTGT